MSGPGKLRAGIWGLNCNDSHFYDLSCDGVLEDREKGCLRVPLGWGYALVPDPSSDVHIAALLVALRATWGQEGSLLSIPYSRPFEEHQSIRAQSQVMGRRNTPSTILFYFLRVTSSGTQG